MIRKYFIFTFVILFLTTYTYADESLYYGSQQEYLIHFPKAWSVKKQYSQQIDILATDGGIGRMAYIHIEPFSPLSSTGFLLENLTQLFVRYPQAKIVKQGQEILFGKIVPWVIFTNSLGNDPIQVLEYYVVTEHHAYIIGFLTSPRDFDPALPSFQKIVHSFQVLKSGAPSNIKLKANTLSDQQLTKERL